LEPAVISLAAVALLACSPIDADTIDCREPGSEIVERIRLVNVDAPESFGPRCAYERDLAARAMAFTRDWLARGPVHVERTGIDRSYPRVRTLAYVSRDGRDLGAELVAAGLARAWDGKRRSWCK
jgi:micrococcal nuclease